MELYKKVLGKFNNKEKFYFYIKENFSFTCIFFNKKIRRTKYNLHIKKNMEKKINKYDDLSFPIKMINLDVKIDKTIWICWFQGIDEAPALVKTCYQSVIKAVGHNNVVLIDDKNINQYIQLPEFIMKKRNDGLISDAHFSDILRLELLTTYGGTWIDATVFIANSSSIDKIRNQELFLFSNIMRDTESILFSNWLIHSIKENELLLDTRKYLYGYWSNHKRINNYFLFHILLSIVYDRKGMSIPIVSNVPPHVLQLVGDKKLDKKILKLIFDESGIQKLSYKVQFDEGNLKNLQKIVGVY